ncbi:cytochrome P450-like protein, partial [Tanacetum coccineum]
LEPLQPWQFNSPFPVPRIEKFPLEEASTKFFRSFDHGFFLTKLLPARLIEDFHIRVVVCQSMYNLDPRTFAKISAKHGAILLLRFGFRRVLLVSSSSISEECFTKNDTIFAARPRLIVAKILAVNYTNVAASSYGEHWRNLRKISASNFFPLKGLASTRMNALTKQDSLYSDVDMEEDGKRFQEIVKETFLIGNALNLRDHLPFLRWFGVNELENKLIALQKKRCIRTRLQETDPEYYTDELIKNYVLNMLSAGLDTSAATMEWAFSLLLNHKHVLKKAQNEIDNHVGKDHLVDESDMASLPYLYCIVNETMRMYPPAPLLLPHESAEDCVVGGYHVPRGTMLFVNQWAIHHDPNLWSDPERFNPERFEKPEVTSDGYRFMPFGSGRRICPGDGLAMRMIGLALGLLIQCFDWERISEEMIDMTEGHGLTMPKAQPLLAKCRPRSVMQKFMSEI